MKGEMKQKIYNFLVDYIKENGFAPNVREIGNAVGLKSTSSVYHQLCELKDDGKIMIKGKASRAIKLIDYEYVQRKK